MYKHLDLFSGIGGFSLAAKDYGFETIGYVEKDEYARKILNQNFTLDTLERDICLVDFSRWDGEVDLLTAGFPCQPFSQIGKGLQENDDRYLWPELLRAVSECQPKFCLFENVPALRTKGADRIFGDMERNGYSVGSFVVSASSIGNSHIRSRVWIVGYSNSLKWRTKCLMPDFQQSDKWGPRSEFEGVNRSFLFPPSPDEIIKWENNSEGESRMYMPGSECRICDMANGISRRVAQKEELIALGNSLVPQIAGLFIKWIKIQLDMMGE